MRISDWSSDVCSSDLQCDLAHAPVVFELDVDAISVNAFPAPAEISRQPVVIRDLAVWAGLDVSYKDLLNTLTHVIESNAILCIVKDIKLFDVWRDKSAETNEKSMAFRFWLQRSEEHTSELLSLLRKPYAA